MNKFKSTFLAMFLFSSLSIFSQGREVEMADALRENGKIYVVVLVLCILFVGIIAYLIKIDRDLKKLEKEIQK